MKLLKLMRRSMSLELAADMAYKGNFFVKLLAVAFGDVIGPILTLLIYSTTAGIPGWTIYEFLLLQGTFIFAYGLGHVFLIVLPWIVTINVDEGEFDKYLIRPYNTLLFTLTRSFNLDGFPELIVGPIVILFAASHLDIVFGLNVLAYLILIALAFFVQAAAMIFIAALCFIFVRSHALLELYTKLVDFARYPVTIYTLSMGFFVSFIFPVMAGSFYPVQALLHGMNVLTMVKLAVPTGILLFLSVRFWNWALRGYRSAGG